jgi:hypothetical protein
MPFFFVPGNHDITNPAMAEKWCGRFGRTYYHFVYAKVLFLCLNTEDTGKGVISPAQVSYVKRVLAKNRGVRWTLVFMHQPLWRSEGNDGWQQVERLLAARKYTVFAGHEHRYSRHVRNGRTLFVLGTTGGANSGRGAALGELDHIVWVTMCDDGPRIANIALDGILDEEFFTAELAALDEGARDGAVVAVEPIFRGKEASGTAESKVILTNASDIEMHVEISFAPHEALKVKPGTIERSIPPDGAEFVDVALSVRNLCRTGLPVPLVMSWTTTYRIPERQAMVIHGATGIWPDHLYECRRRSSAVRVDGSLDEWSDLAIACEEPEEIMPGRDTWKGRTDCRFRFSAEHDESFVYIAVKAYDDTLRMEAGRLPWEQDGIEIRIDARADPRRSNSRGLSEPGDVLLLALSPKPDVGETSLLYEAGLLPRGTTAVCVVSDSGFVTEAAVPVAWLDLKHGSPWEAFRLNITVDDHDRQEVGCRLWWKPAWHGESNYVGSGTFARVE